MVISTAIFFLILNETQKASPQETVSCNVADGHVSVTYSRPSKRGRVIFGNVVPYGETWRTGANRATTFDTDIDLLINGEKLPAGHYTLWTIPNEHVWEVIWNKQDYLWGIKGNKAARNPQFDMLTVRSTPMQMNTVQDTFAIEFDQDLMAFAWDNVRVEVLMQSADN